MRRFLVQWPDIVENRTPDGRSVVKTRYWGYGPQAEPERRPHAADYTSRDATAVADWLNSRAAGYPELAKFQLNSATATKQGVLHWKVW
jgi:hypothetical protein